MADLQASYEKAEQEYKQQKDMINTATEEADSKKVDIFSHPNVAKISICRISIFVY